MLAALRKRELSLSPNFSHSLATVPFSEQVQFVQRLELQRLLVGHRGCVNTISFDETGDTLVSGSDDRDVALWNWQTGKRTLRYESGHHGNVFQAKPLPLGGGGGMTVVTCARDGQVRLTVLGEGGGGDVPATSRMLARHGGASHKLALEPGSPHCFYSCGEDGEVRHFDLRAGEHQEGGRRLLRCSTRPSMAEAGRIIALYAIHANPARPWQFAVCGRDTRVRVYDQRYLPGAAAAAAAAASSGSLSYASLAEPVAMLAPGHMVGPRAQTGAHVTCVQFSGVGEVLGTWNDEDVYLFAPPGASGGGGGSAADSGAHPAGGAQAGGGGDGGGGGGGRGRGSPALGSRRGRGGGGSSGSGAARPQQPQRQPAKRSRTLPPDADAQARLLVGSRWDPAHRQPAARALPTALADAGHDGGGGGGEPPGNGLPPPSPLLPPSVPPGAEASGAAAGAVSAEAGAEAAAAAEAGAAAAAAAEAGAAAGAAAAAAEGQQQQEEEGPMALDDEEADGGDGPHNGSGETAETSSSSSSLPALVQRSSSESSSLPGLIANSTTTSSGGSPPVVVYQSHAALRAAWAPAGTQGWGAGAANGEDGSDGEEDEFIDGGWRRRVARRRGGGGDGDEGDEVKGDDACGTGRVLMRFRGHRNSRTVKGVSFFGPRDGFVVSGSDDGHVYIWEKETGKLRSWLTGDSDVVNCLEPHPCMPFTLATSGIDHNIKVFEPTAPDARLDVGREANEAMRRNRAQQGTAMGGHLMMLPPHLLMQLMQVQGMARVRTSSTPVQGQEGAVPNSDGDDEDEGGDGLPDLVGGGELTDVDDEEEEEYDDEDQAVFRSAVQRQLNGDCIVS